MWFEFKDDNSDSDDQTDTKDLVSCYIYLCGFMLHYLWSVALMLQLLLVTRVLMLYVQ